MIRKINLIILFIVMLSNASMAQFAYRSAVATGNWNAIASWERFNGTSWAAATTGQIPGASDTVYIQTGHTISLTQNENCYTLNLHSATTSRLNLSGFILNVHGNLGCFSSAINVYPVTFTGSTPSTTTWINTSTAGSAIRLVGDSRNATNTGQWGNNPPGWNLEVSLNSGQTATFNTGFKANRVTIISGTLQTANGNDIRPDNAAATTGDLIINPGAKLTLSGSLRRTGTAGAQFDSLIVNGTLELAGTSARGVDATTFIVGNGGKVSHIGTTAYTGVITNYNYASGSSLEYAGTAAQTSGAEFPANNVKKLVINNSNGVTITGTRTVNDTLQMIVGNVTVPTTDSLILGSSANATLLRTSGNIIGRINRFISGTTTGMVVFPTGSANFYRPVSVNFVSAPIAGGNISVMHVDSGIGGTSISNIADGSYTVNRRSNMFWTGSINNGLTALNLTLTINANGIAGISNASENRIIASADNGLTFGIPGGTHAAGSGSTATRTNFQVIPTTFRMYMGGNATTNPLPVTLKYFKSSFNDQSVWLMWATSSEVNNKGFFIERSEDGVNFEQIGFVEGMGNSQKIVEYKYQDFTTLAIAYYRLTQVDFDGTTESSEIVRIERNLGTINVAPNPFNGMIRIASENNQDQISVTIYDLQGKEKLKANGNGSLHVDAQNLEAGIYLLEIKQGDTKQVKRIIKN